MAVARDEAGDLDTPCGTSCQVTTTQGGPHVVHPRAMLPGDLAVPVPGRHPPGPGHWAAAPSGAAVAREHGAVSFLPVAAAGPSCRSPHVTRSSGVRPRHRRGRTAGR